MRQGVAGEAGSERQGSGARKGFSEREMVQGRSMAWDEAVQVTGAGGREGSGMVGAK